MITSSQDRALTEVVLERLRVSLGGISVSRHLLSTLEIARVEDYLADAVHFQFEAWMAGLRQCDVTRTVEFEKPASAWQHVKAEWFPTFSRWLRRPPRMTAARFEVNASSWLAFPDANLEFPKSLARPVRVGAITNVRQLPDSAPSASE